MDCSGLQIHTAMRCASWVRLVLVGELTLVTADVLRDHLALEFSCGHRVLLDLSRVTFMDTHGMSVLIRGTSDAAPRGGWLAIEPDLAAQPGRLLSLADRLDLLPA